MKRLFFFLLLLLTALGAHADIIKPDANTNASTECSAGQFYEGDGSCTDVIEESELDSEAELETQVGVSVYTSSDLTITSGTYTPTITTVTNLDGTTAYEAQYLRVGSTVTVSGKFDADVTTGSTTTTFRMTLPVSSTLGTPQDCSGVMAGRINADRSHGTIQADTSNNEAEFNFYSSPTSNQAYYFTFTYQII